MQPNSRLIILLILLLATPLQAGLRLLDGNDFYKVPFEIIIDPEGKLTFKDVKDSPNFKATEKDAYGFINDTIWARFTVTIPEGNTTEWFLEIGYPLLNYIDIYNPGINDVYTVKHYGNKFPFNKRDINHHNFLIRLHNNPGTYVYYIRFQTASSMNIPMKIHSLKSVISELDTQKTMFGLFYGALLIILVYNILLALSMRETAYLWYSLFIIALIGVSLQLNGYGFQYLWSNILWMNDLVPFFLFLTNFTLTLFSINYIDPQGLNKFFRYAIYIYVGIIAFFTLLSLFLPYHLTIIVGATAYLPGIGLVSSIAVSLIIQKRREAYFYSVAWSFLFAGVIITVLNRFGLLPNHPLILWAFQFGTAFSIALFSLGLADRVNMLKNNLAEINIHLEEKVEDRTKELSAAKDEVEAAMEELEAVNDRLVDSNRELEEAQAMSRKDMNMAANLQLSLLPKKTPVSPLYDIALTFIPKSGVSGDFYDFYIDKNSLAGIGVFDVSGHGIAPGLLTLMAKSIIATTFFELQNENLGAVVEKINIKLLSEIKEIDNYLTGVLLRFRDDMIEYINCAHPDIICRKNDIDRTGKVLDKNGQRVSGPFLGIDHSTARGGDPYKDITFKLKQGDTLLIYTDSFCETPGPDGREYGESGIMKSFHNARGGSAEEVLNIITADFFNYLGTSELHDDLTVIVVRKK